MSEFSVNLFPITVSEHPNADVLELASIGGYNSIVPKGKYSTGDIVFYFPTASLLTDEILQACGLWDGEAGQGTLSGPNKNKVKPIRLRGELSEGIVAAPEDLGITLAGPVDFDHDYADELGVTKWVPRVPTNFTGKWIGNADIIPMGDIENHKSPKWNKLIQPGEEVLITEKIHGTCCVINFRNGVFSVTSKGLGKRRITIEEEIGNVYWDAVRRYQLESLAAFLGNLFVQLDETPINDNVAIFAEVFGPGVQSGFTYGKNEKELRIFDVSIGDKFLCRSDIERLIDAWVSHLLPDIPNRDLLVPLLYQGPYCPDAAQALADGKETVSGKETHIREGVVVSVEPPACDQRTGKRRRLKIISDAYLTRKGKGTEYE